MRKRNFFNLTNGYNLTFITLLISISENSSIFVEFRQISECILNLLLNLNNVSFGHRRRPSMILLLLELIVNSNSIVIDEQVCFVQLYMIEHRQIDLLFKLLPTASISISLMPSMTSQKTMIIPVPKVPSLSEPQPLRAGGLPYPNRLPTLSNWNERSCSSQIICFPIRSWVEVFFCSGILFIFYFFFRLKLVVFAGCTR